MFLIKGINKSGDWESKVVKCDSLTEALSKAKEGYTLVQSIRYFSEREDFKHSGVFTAVKEAF